MTFCMFKINEGVIRLDFPEVPYSSKIKPAAILGCYV